MSESTALRINVQMLTLVNLLIMSANVPAYISPGGEKKKAE
jgi:hypothetical protein